ALGGGERYSTEPVHVAIAIPRPDARGAAAATSTHRRLGDALEALGWRVSMVAPARDGVLAMDKTVEAIVVLDERLDIRELPRRLITLAWIEDGADGWCERVWFDEFDLVLASTDRAIETVGRKSAKVAHLVAAAANDAANGSA